MKIAIAGSGAMGCRFGAMLHRCGNEVVLIDYWDKHIEAINTNGLQIMNETGIHNQKIEAFYPHELKEKMDLIIVFTKAMQTEEMIRDCKHLIGSETRILTLQNGLGNVEILEKYVTRKNLVAGVTTFGTELFEPGKIRAFGSGDVHMMQVDGEVTEHLNEIAAVMNEAKMNVQISPNVFISIWNKVAFNSVWNTFCTLMNDTVGAVGSYSAFEEMIESVVNEIIEVARAEGVKLNKDDIYTMITEVIDPDMSGNHYPSMLQDMEHGRETEIDFLNGAIVQKAKNYGIPVPVNELITHLIKMKAEIRDKRHVDEVKK